MIIQKLYDFIKINYFLMPKTQHNEYCVAFYDVFFGILPEKL